MLTVNCLMTGFRRDKTITSDLFLLQNVLMVPLDKVTHGILNKPNPRKKNVPMVTQLSKKMLSRMITGVKQLFFKNTRGTIKKS